MSADSGSGFCASVFYGSRQVWPCVEGFDNINGANSDGQTSVKTVSGATWLR